MEDDWESVALDLEAVNRRMGGLLTEIANALKGGPGELASHDWSDLPEVARRVVAERDDLARRLEGA